METGPVDWGFIPGSEKPAKVKAPPVYSKKGDAQESSGGGTPSNPFLEEAPPGASNPFDELPVSMETEIPPGVFEHPTCCMGKEDSTLVNFAVPNSMVTQGFCCGGLFGSGARRVSLATRDLTSFHFTSLRRLACLRSATLTLRSGPLGEVQSAFPHGEVALGVASLVHVSNIAAGKAPDRSTRSITRGGKCNARSLLDCTVRKTEWHFGPGSAMHVGLKEERCGCQSLLVRESVSGALVDRVRVVEAFSPLGLCACRQTPSGRCSREDFVTLGLSDGEEIYGGVQKGDSRLILEEIASRRRVVVGGEGTVISVRGSDALTFCCGYGAQLTVTSEKVTLVVHNQSPCEKAASCGLCMGAFARTMLLEDVVSVECMQPRGCDIAGGALRGIGGGVAKLYKVLNCGGSLGVIAALVALAGVTGVVLYAGTLGPRGGPGCTGPIQCRRQDGQAFNITFLPHFLPGFGDEIYIILFAGALIVLAAMGNGVDPAALLGIFIGLFRDTLVLLSSIVTTPLAFLLPCCHRSQVVIKGLHGDITFKVRPQEDFQLTPFQVASHIMDKIEAQKTTKRLNAEGAALQAQASMATVITSGEDKARSRSGAWAQQASSSYGSGSGSSSGWGVASPPPPTPSSWGDGGVTTSHNPLTTFKSM